MTDPKDREMLPRIAKPKFDNPDAVRAEIEHLQRLAKMMTDPGMLAGIRSLIGELEQLLTRLESGLGVPD